jgi:hypothetical protein
MGQQKPSFYDRVISDVKNSTEFIDFCNSHEIIDLNFKVKQYLFPFCENYNMFSKEVKNKKLINHCDDANWFSEEIIKDKRLKRKCDRGKKLLTVYFSGMVDDYIVVEIVAKKIEHESFLFLYKVTTDDLIEKIDEVHLFKN